MLNRLFARLFFWAVTCIIAGGLKDRLRFLGAAWLLSMAVAVIVKGDPRA